MEECERKHLVEDERLGPVPIPFGFQHRQWMDLKSRIEKGDELWEFCSPPKTWEDLCGRAGVCIVRDGEVIDSIITLEN